MRPSPGTGWLLVLISGVLQIVCFPSPGLYFLCWIALAPLFVVVIDRRYSPTVWRGVLFAYFNGVLWYAGTCFWIFHVMHTYGNFPKPVAAGLLVLFCLYLALYHAAFGLLLGWITRRKITANARALVLAPVLWVMVELGRAHITSFPWDLLGYAQVNNVPLTRIASFTGVYGLSFAIALVNSILALGFILPRESRIAVALAGVLGAIALESGVLVPYPPVHPDHTAELVQQNLPIFEGNWPPSYYDLTMAQLVQLSSSSAAGTKASNPPLIVWPESPAPFYTADPRFQHWMTALAQDSHAYLIVGALGVTPTDQKDKPLLFNSAQLIAPDGAFVSRYDKIHLVPFGEFVPFRNLLTFAQSLLHDISDLSRGNQRNVLQVDSHSIGTFICYESIFPDEVLQFARNRAELFVNISDDAWYGEYGAPGQHLNMARMRAIENNRWLLRATNSGITASISPFGQVIAEVPPNVRTVLQAPYSFESGTSFYTRHGDWFAHLCAIISVLALFVALVGGRLQREYRHRSFDQKTGVQ
jgi:apolipoprotein N-acyltransferase